MRLKTLFTIICTLFLTGFIFAACSEDGTSRQAAESDGDSDSDSDSDSDGDSDSDSDSDSDGDSDSDSDSDSDTDNGSETDPDLVALGERPPDDTLNTSRLDRITCEYRTIEETDTTFKGEIIVGNTNSEYVWNGYYFDIYSVNFTTTSTITSAKTDGNIAINFSQTDRGITFDMGWQSKFPLNQIITFNVEGTKSGQYPYPARCTPKYMRGDVVYPEYPRLPYSWWPGKENVRPQDLIRNEDDYYKKNVPAVTEGIFLYHPPHDTQILIGLADHVNYTVNGYTNLRIFIPSKMLALGLGYTYQWFKFNPNYLCALGTKENFACGLTPVIDSSQSLYTVTLDDIDYHWYISFIPDGPFQQETGNFTDMAKYFPDYFAPGAAHDSYVTVAGPDDNLHWITSVISSALSSVVTRESLWALTDIDYGKIALEAVDPWAEQAVITFAYNRGIYSTCGTGVFNDIDATISTQDVAGTYNLTGVADHVGTIIGITDAMNSAVDKIYDEKLTIEDIEFFFDTLKTSFYGRGVPSDDEWAAMMVDIKKAFDVLSAHWGDDTISFRYDFLTILRVAQGHLPEPTNTRPTGEDWYNRVTQFPDCG